MSGISRLGDAYSLAVDTKIYALDAVKKAAYKFAERATIVINPGPNTSVEIRFTFVGRQGGNSPEQVIADFATELLDQDLREIIKRETTHVRNLILAHAFSRTSLVEQG